MIRLKFLFFKHLPDPAFKANEFGSKGEFQRADCVLKVTQITGFESGSKLLT